MIKDNDMWDLQEAYSEDPKKAIFILSSFIFQPDKLSSQIIKAIDKQSDLQDKLKLHHLGLIEKDEDTKKALSKFCNNQRRSFYLNLVFNKRVGIAMVILVLSAGAANLESFLKYCNKFNTIVMARK